MAMASSSAEERPVTPTTALNTTSSDDEGEHGTPIFKDAVEESDPISQSTTQESGFHAAGEANGEACKDIDAGRKDSKAGSPPSTPTIASTMAVGSGIATSPSTGPSVVETAASRNNSTSGSPGNTMALSPTTSVASLRRRFEMQDMSKPQLPMGSSSNLLSDASRGESRLTSSCSPKNAAAIGKHVPSPLLVKDNNIIPEGTDALLLEQENAASKAVIESEAASPRAPMSASLGAKSMTEPDSTLINPFSTPVDAWAQEKNGAETETTSALGAMNSWQSALDPPPAPATDGWSEVGSSHAEATNGHSTGMESSADQRFSSISLGGTTTQGTPRVEQAAKMGSIEEALSEAQRAPLSRESKRWSATSASAAGRAGRRSAILGFADDRKDTATSTGGVRVSIDGLEKLRENFERVQKREKNRQSVVLGKPPQSQKPESEVPAAQSLADGEEEAPQTEQALNGASNENEDDTDDHIDWPFWGRVMSDYQSVARNNPQELSRAIQLGIPATLRGMMWQLMSGSKDEEMEMIYAFYLKQTSPHEKAIRRDLARTFPEQGYFQEGAGTGQENLFNVVKAYSLYDEECGYCQGMQFVVGPLLLNMPDEEAFSTLVRLMKAYDLRGHFIPNMPSLQLRLYQFNRLLEDTLPLLHMHLVRIGIKSSMYASQWFMTLFSYRFPLDLVYRILDSVFAEGVEALFRFALALMEKNEDTLLKLNFENCLTFLKENLFDLYQKDEWDEKGKALYRTNDFVQDAFQIRVMSYNLDQYASEFEEQVRAANAHRREVEALRLVNRNLAAKVKELEENAAAQSAEHVELVKQVVMANLAKDEMAEELVKYKVMYAEAVLSNDQGNAREMGSVPNSSSFDRMNLLSFGSR
ncbi:RabGAP/TBC [Tilletiaria anomala UBC 951]|uniref:RabGAP/TBC n=1 Tax=Tilletiaria anomala (strain ATCC 24038 / CBS 436.72 / UBC 951) TaxID=1037660 RepID=A0A066WFF6_TILAU|nr:RabGAP/TBC [Tilletiaria anomala UBC 951]KDN52516.1 RabGAP/TBC [Tilletiaria anomala UBC 951]